MSADLQALGIALGLGLLVGLQRTWSDHPEAGVRTFSLVTMLGVMAAILGRDFGGWLAAAGMVSVGGLLVVANLIHHRADPTHDAGMTTEVAALAGR
ncbi:MAG: MgtC/SapB family protein [Longimicrobiales bacterium]